MYKHTKSTSKISVYKDKPNPQIYLEKIYESSKTIFVGRDIISEKLFGEIPKAHPSALISSNRKYLQRIGYLETQISQLPDWFLFHPKIGLLIKFLKDAAIKNPKSIPFELNFIAFDEKPKINAPNNSIKAQATHKKNEEKTAFEIAFENARNR